MRDIKNSQFIDIVSPPRPGNINEENDFAYMVASPPQRLISSLLSTKGQSDKIKKLVERRKSISKSTKMDFAKSDDLKIYTLRSISGTEQLEVSMIHSDLLSRRSRPLIDFFVFLSIKIAQEAVKSGKLIKDTIYFSTQELVSLGMYGSKRKARDMFIEISPALRSISLSGLYLVNVKNEKGKDTASYTDTSHKGTNLFIATEATERTGILAVSLSPKINWEAYARFFAPLPKYYFALKKPRAKDLLLNIFYLAALNKTKIKKFGKFSISLRNVQAFLGLVDDDTDNPLRNIKEPIEEAISAIEEMSSKYDKNCEFTITPYPELKETRQEMTIKEFLDRGYLEIGMSGKYAEFYINGYNRQQEIVEKNTKEQEKIKQEISVRAGLKKKKEQEQS